MNYQEFVEKVKGAKKSQKYSYSDNLKLIRNKNKYIISKGGVCKHCKKKWLKSVYIEFKEEHRMTIFEVGLLYMLFCENKIPYDYAGFHNCEAGKEFIENIKEVKTIEI